MSEKLVRININMIQTWPETMYLSTFNLKRIVPKTYNAKIDSAWTKMIVKRKIDNVFVSNV